MAGALGARTCSQLLCSLTQRVLAEKHGSRTEDGASAPCPADLREITVTYRLACDVQCAVVFLHCDLNAACF
jgi:hypothetical protein